MWWDMSEVTATGTAVLSVSSTTRSGDYCNFPNTKSDCGLASSSHSRHSKSVLQVNAVLFHVGRHILRRNTTPVKLETSKALKSVKITCTGHKQNLCLTEHLLLPAVLYLLMCFSFRFSLHHSFCVLPICRLHPSVQQLLCVLI